MRKRTAFKPTLQERDWLQKLAKRVHATIRNIPQGDALGDSVFKAQLTGDGDSGWWVDLGNIRGIHASLSLFIDDTRPDCRTLPLSRRSWERRRCL